LLVVDFGYLIPTWLLQLPAIAPLNIHPSELPKWRGSSPGQFALLFKNLGRETTQTAVTLMVMNEGLDQDQLSPNCLSPLKKTGHKLNIITKLLA
jgi:methionyl-tRNA formyltransferase